MKRHPSLQPLSREHHFSLLLCWKIRKGLEKGISVERMRRYLVAFWNNQMQTHFDVEEAYILPVLGLEHEGVQRIIKDHRWLKRLFLSNPYSPKTLNRIEEVLESHIRFEERELFPEVQRKATTAQWDALEEAHNTAINELQWEDDFWNE